MHTDRLVREVEKRLAGLAEPARNEVLDALREEIARENRRVEPSFTVEAERERRVEAETLREVLEAINRQARLEDTIEEVLKQLSKIVTFDSCSLSLLGAEGNFRIIAARGFADPSLVVGTSFRDTLSETIRANPQPICLADAHADDRFVKNEVTAEIRSWAGIPLVVEGELIGLLCLDRHRVEPFEDEDLHRAKALAFSAAAAIRKAQLLDQLRRYAALMEHVVSVDQLVFADRPAREVAGAILDGALRIGTHAGGLLILSESSGPRIAAAVGPFAGTEGRAAPAGLSVRETTRLPAARMPAIALALSVMLPSHPMYLVPLATAGSHLGTLALLDPDGETPNDRLMEAYATRAAAAYLHATRAR